MSYTHPTGSEPDDTIDEKFQATQAGEERFNWDPKKAIWRDWFDEVHALLFKNDHHWLIHFKYSHILDSAPVPVKYHLDASLTQDEAIAKIKELAGLLNDFIKVVRGELEKINDGLNKILEY